MKTILRCREQFAQSIHFRYQGPKLPHPEVGFEDL